MGLFWKRTKKEDEPAPQAAEPQAPPAQQMQIETPPPPQQPAAPEQKSTGFLRNLFRGGEAVPTPTAETAPQIDSPPDNSPAVPRAPEVEKKSIWNRLGFGQSTTETPTAAAASAPTRAQQEEETVSRFQQFRRALNKTSENFWKNLGGALGYRKIDAEVLDSLEEALISTDIGVQTAMEIIENARMKVTRSEINNFDELKKIIKDELLKILHGTKRGVASETEVSADIRPYVMMIVGVNGVGKTTTIGKLANRIKADGNDVLICAADTFRAAAGDQLAIWADRTGVPLIQQKKGTDPAAVLFDSLAAAKSRNSDVLIVDTAGRLHTKSNLMAELEKMKRIASREVPNAPHEVLLVVDAVTGQNGLEQARQFLKIMPVTGLVLTKFDGTAKGGIVVAIAKELNIPIRYVGIGEGINDLIEFSPEDFVNSLFE